MDPESPLCPPILGKEAFNSPLLNTISGFAMIFFAFCVSTGALFLVEIPLATSDQSSNDLLLSMACLTFLLGVTLSPLLLTMNSTKPLGRISARLVDHLTLATLVASFTTLILAMPELSMALTDLNELSHGKAGWAFQSGLICFAVACSYKLVSEKFTSCHHKSLNVAFFNLGIALAGLFTGPLWCLHGTIPYSSFIYQTDRLYQFALVPVTFFLGTIQLILGVTPAVGLRRPFVCVISKEGLTVLTLAVGLTTLLIGTFSMISMALVNLAMPGGVGVGGPAEQ